MRSNQNDAIKAKGVKMADNAELADQFLNFHDADGWFRDPGYDGPCEMIDTDKVDELTNLIQDFIANVIAGILNAGSERDAVNESEELQNAIHAELLGWSRAAELNKGQQGATTHQCELGL